MRSTRHPGYSNFQALLRAHRVELVGITFTTAGCEAAAFEAAINIRAPRLHITNSALHNTSGATMSPNPTVSGSSVL